MQTHYPTTTRVDTPAKYDFLFKSVANAFFIATALISLLVFFIIKIYPIDAEKLTSSSSLIIPSVRLFLRPEPLENLIYLCAVLFFGCISLYYCRQSTAYQSLKSKVAPKYMVGASTVPLLLVLIFIFEIYGTDYFRAVIGKYEQQSFHVIRYFIIFGILAIFYCIIITRTRFSDTSNYHRLALLFWVFIILIIQITSWRILSFNEVSGIDYQWHFHLDPIAFAISQVVGGKTVLVDFQSLYGLYPEFIAVIFKWLPINIFGLSLTFAVLQFVSLITVFYVLSKTIKHKIILFLIINTLLMTTYETYLYISNVIVERYFQYGPIRLLWPMLSVFVFYYFLKGPSFRIGFLMSCLSAMACLWNLDTGVVIVLTFASYLTIRALTSQTKDGESKSSSLRYWASNLYVKLLFTHMITVISIISLFYIYLTLSSKIAVKWDWIFESQNTFYRLGYMALPMPIQFDPWMGCISIYMFAILWSVMSFHRQLHSIKSDLLCYLGILGIGLFSYYQGRSHYLNLIKVGWPAVIILGIMADQILRLVRVRLLSKYHLPIPITIIIFFCFVSFAFIEAIPRLITNMKDRYLNQQVISDPLVAMELAFIIKNMNDKKDCLILSKRQGIYQLEGKSTSPFVGPAASELISVFDNERLLIDIRNRNFQCIFWGNGDRNKLLLGTDIFDLISAWYDVVEELTETSMIYFKPKGIP